MAKWLLRRGERRSEPKNHWDLVILCTRQLKVSDGYWTSGEWIALRMEMVVKEMKERLLGMGVEYRVDREAVGKMPATKTPEDVNMMLGCEQYFMEMLLVCEVREWEKLFWDKFKAFLVEIGKYRVEEKERLTREWRANCWKRLNPQIHAALKRMADLDVNVKYYKDLLLKSLGEEWTLSISNLQVFEGVDNSAVISLSKLRRQIGDGEEYCLRLENEIKDTEFRLDRGSILGQFDLFWNNNLLFNCRYSRSKWLVFSQSSTVPLEVYSHALKGNKNITHITFDDMNSDFDVNRFLCNLPWVTSISLHGSVTIPAVRRDLLYIESNDLNTFAKEIKLDPSSTYIFSDTGISAFKLSSDKLNNARVLISFVVPKSGKRLILRVKHSGKEDAPLEVTLGSARIQLNPSSKSSLTMDDITLFPIEVSGPSESDHLSFVPEVQNVILIQYRGTEELDYYLHDIEA